jgi:hypothetical protein
MAKNTENLGLYEKESTDGNDTFNITQMLNNNWDKIDDFAEDYEYQTPTVTGTQIQLIKKSDTKILKFKLSNDLTGGNITISTDAGATNKPLVDTDGTQVTSLEKGFVEVVADADFFTLHSKGLSSGDKQALIDIANNAEVYNSTVKSNIINAVNSKAGTSLSDSSAWNDIKNAIGGIQPSDIGGRKYVPGSGTTNSTARATISGLSFTPSIILLSLHSYLFAWYVNQYGWGGQNPNVIRSVGYGEMLDITLASDGFSIIGDSSYANLNFNWIAIE